MLALAVEWWAVTATQAHAQCLAWYIHLGMLYISYISG